MELPGKQSTRIAAFMPNVDAFDESQWPAIQSWMLNMMQKFKAAFASRIKTLDLSASDLPSELDEMFDQSEP